MANIGALRNMPTPQEIQALVAKFSFADFNEDMKIASKGLNHSVAQELVLTQYLEHKAYSPLVYFLRNWNWEIGRGEIFNRVAIALKNDSQVDHFEKLWSNLILKQASLYLRAWKLCTPRTLAGIGITPQRLEKLKEEVTRLKERLIQSLKEYHNELTGWGNPNTIDQLKELLCRIEDGRFKKSTRIKAEPLFKSLSWPQFSA